MHDHFMIKREFDMLSRDLRLAHESFLLRIIRNKRQPSSARFAALLHYEGLPWEHWLSLPGDPDEAEMLEGIAQFLHEIDRAPA